MTYEEIQSLIEENLANGSRIPATKHREVEFALLDYIQANIAQQGDIKRVKCNLQYLQDNFEVNGLGKNLRLGWAICNGNNGTDNLAGRVGVGYGLGYSVLGGLGGSPDAVLVAHTHTYNTSNDDSGDDGQYVVTSPREPSGLKRSVDTTGVSGVNKNMQPYIINLYIMKL